MYFPKLKLFVIGQLYKNFNKFTLLKSANDFDYLLFHLQIYLIFTIKLNVARKIN